MPSSPAVFSAPRRRLLAGAGVATALVLLLAGCASEQQPADDGTTEPGGGAAEIPGVFVGDATVPEGLDDDLNVALVTRITTGSWYETYADAIESEVEGLGGTLQVYDSSNDLSRMASNVDAVVNSGADVLLINNGTAEALDGSVQRALDAGIPVVTYDSDITLEGVSAINQDDTALARNGLEQIGTDFDGEADLVVLSVAGYAPLDNRLAAVDDFVAENPGIEIVTQTGTVSGSAALDTAAQINALLRANPEPGQVDVIWSHWNEFTKGAFSALQESGRTDIAVYTIDLTDAELPYFWDDSVNFQLASATNPATIGRSQVRLAWQLAAGEEVGDLVVQPNVVTRDDLPDEEIAYTELAEYVPAWVADDSEWPAWIRTLHER